MALSTSSYSFWFRVCQLYGTISHGYGTYGYGPNVSVNLLSTTNQCSVRYRHQGIISGDANEAGLDVLYFPWMEKREQSR